MVCLCPAERRRRASPAGGPATRVLSRDAPGGEPAQERPWVPQVAPAAVQPAQPNGPRNDRGCSLQTARARCRGGADGTAGENDGGSHLEGDGFQVDPRGEARL